VRPCEVTRDEVTRDEARWQEACTVCVSELTPSAQAVVDGSLIVGRQLLDARHAQHPTRNITRRHGDEDTQ